MPRRKQATTDILTEVPELEEGQRFARVLGSRGKNIHEVQFEDGEDLLVNLPPKFRNLVWVKRGTPSFCISEGKSFPFNPTTVID